MGEYEPLLRHYAAMIAQRSMELTGIVPAYIEQIESGRPVDFRVIWMRNRHTYQELEAWATQEMLALGPADGTRLS